MNHKYPNKRKRKGFWKRYEKAQIKDFRKVWETSLEIITQEGTPFENHKFGRKPNLSKEERVCMSILHVYFNQDFRETEHLVNLLIGKKLDHSNCVRWFGKLTSIYINKLIFKIHKKIIGISNVGDYIADSTKVTCDRLNLKDFVDEKRWVHQTWKLHILVQYIFSLGLISIVNTFASKGESNDSPPLRNNLLKRSKVEKGKKLHADKGYFGKENLKKCERFGLQPNIVPKEQKHSDKYLKKYIKKIYDNESRKNTRGLVEGVFGGMETETRMIVRCRKPKHRDIFLCLMALKHNLKTLFKATALNSFYSILSISHQPQQGLNCID